MNLILPMTVTGLLVTGMGLALLGSVMAPLARKLQIDEARVGGLVSLFGLTMIPVILAAGFLADALGRQAMFIGGALLMALSLVTLALARKYTVALLAVLLLSAAWSAQANVINVVSPHAFLKPEDIKDKISFATNLGNVFFGLGAFLTPLAAALVLRRFGLTRPLLVLAAIVLIPAALAIGVDFDALNQTADGQETLTTAASATTASLLSDPVMWLCALAMFFYGPLEAAVAAWTTTYLGEKGVSEGRASSLLSGFWLSFMASRLVTAFWLGPAVSGLVERFDLSVKSEALLILAMGAIAVAVLSGMVWLRSAAAASAMVIAAGLVFGPIFPSIMAILLGHFDAAVQGRAVGLLFAIGGLGWTSIPMAIGAYAKRTSVQRGFIIAVASAVGLCAIGVALVAMVSP